jgi:hypothetical protein
MGLPGSKRDTRPENEILVCSARVIMDMERAERMRELLKQTIDWTYMLEAAYWHGTLPLLYRHLSAASPNSIPDRFLNQLRDSVHEITAWNLLLMSQLIKLLGLFRSHGIEVLPFKGPVLAASVYGDIALRHFWDIDILVKKRDVSNAAQLLIDAGYSPQFSLTREQERVYAQAYCEHTFRHEGMGAVDLHWGLIPPQFSFAPDPEPLWGRSRRIDLGGHTVSTLSPEDMCLFLSLHGAKHYWSQLNWIVDLAELIRAHEDMDWESIIDQAAAMGARRMLFLGLFLAGDLLEAPLPDEVAQKARAARQISSLADGVYGMLFPRKKVRAISMKQNIYYVKTMDRVSDKMRFCAGYTVPTPLEWSLLRLPRSLSFLYYLLRPVRLAAKYGRKALKRIIARDEAKAQ